MDKINGLCDRKRENEKTGKRDEDSILMNSHWQQKESRLIIRGFEKNPFRLKPQNNSSTEIAQLEQITCTQL